MYLYKEQDAKNHMSNRYKKSYRIFFILILIKQLNHLKGSNIIPLIDYQNYQNIQIQSKISITRQSSGNKIGTATFPGAQASGMSKINQDAIIIDRKLNLFAVADGHGQGGERVSNFIRLTLPRHLENQVLESRDALQKAIVETNYELLNSKIETALAGSTLTGIWMKGQKFYSFNVGDSRCVLARQSGNSWQAIELTKDQKPNREDEAIRIIKSGGRIAAQQDIYGNQIGPLRVWLKSVNAPGLAMTRSMGDKVGIQAGVIGIPEIAEYQITPQDKIIIIASDGVWEYLESSEVVQLCAQFYNMNSDILAQKILSAAIDSWKRHSLSRDDISCIVIYL